MNERLIFIEALDRNTPAERAAYLDAVCAGDPALRERVEALLRSHEEAGSFLARPPLAGPQGTAPFVPTGSATPSPDDPPPTAGTLVAGRYKLLEVIGEGGMGTVWMAEQTEPVKRRVAIKLVKPGMDSRGVLARFEAERQALALMDHPNIARVLDGGATSGGRPYFVMELVKGVPITQFCDDRKLTPRQRLELFIPVCQAIQHAHQKGVIHRDIKPSNVLVALYDDRPVPKVIDFGVVKAIGQPLTEQTLFTGFGAVVGTVEYMSPEQASFNQLDVDTRSDIYSLGVVLYELLAGSPPFTRKDLERAGVLEMLRMIREQEPSKPSTKLSTAEGLPTLAANRGTEPKQLTSLVRGELDWIVMKALEKDRGRRYESASAFAVDVQRYLADEPVQAGPPTARYRLRKFLRRNRGPAAAAAAIAFLLVAGIVGTSVGLVQALQAKSAAAAAEGRAREEADVATAVRSFLEEDLLLSAGPDWQAMRGMPANPDLKLRTVVDRAAARLADQFKDRPLVELALRKTLGETYRSLGDVPNARAQLQRCHDLAVQRWGETHPYTLETMVSLAMLALEEDKGEEALKLLLRVKDHSDAAWAIDSPDHLSFESNLAVAYIYAGQPGQGEALLTEAVDRRRRLLGPSHHLTLVTMNNLGLAYERQRKVREAEEWYLQTLDAARRGGGDANFYVVVALKNLINLYSEQGNWKKALPLADEIVPLSLQVLGEGHPRTVECLYAAGEVYRELNETEKYKTTVGRLVELAPPAFGTDHPFTHTSLNEQALIYYGEGRIELAEAMFLRVVAICRRMYAPGKAEWITNLESLARVYEDQGKYTEAESLRREVLEAVRAKGHRDDELGARLFSLANNLVSQRKYPDAEVLLRESLAIVNAQRPGSISVHTVGSLLGAALTGQKKLTEAEPLLLEAYREIRKADEREEQRKGGQPNRVREALKSVLQRLVQLYETSGKADEAAKWRKELDALAEPPKAKKS